MGQIICWIDLKTCQFFSAEVNLLTAGQLGRAELRQQVIFSKQLTCFEKLTCCLSSARRDCPAVKRLTSAEKNWHVFRSIKQMILPILCYNSTILVNFAPQFLRNNRTKFNLTLHIINYLGDRHVRKKLVEIAAKKNFYILLRACLLPR